MAAFSYYLDSNIFIPDTAPTITMDDCFSQFYSPELFNDSILELTHHESSCVDHCSNSKVVSHSDNEPSVGEKQSSGCGDSTVVDKLENGEQITQNVSLGCRKKRKTALNSAKSNKDAKGGKKKKKCKNAMKIEKKSGEEPKTGYIHVRARRGQATDNHSLAERVRRKKISERMKMLQCLVPGCEKITGKALMLDEIINYVQSLQNQVEFLSMKLATVNPMFYDFGVDLEGFMVKPERVNNSEASTTRTVLPCLQQSSPTQGSAFVDSTTTNFAPSHNYPLLYASSSPALLLHHAQSPILFSSSLPQDNGSILWDVEDQRQKFLNSWGLNDNLCSFH